VNDLVNNLTFVLFSFVCHREGELRGQPANPGSPGKMAIKMVCLFLCLRKMEDVCVQFIPCVNHVKTTETGINLVELSSVLIATYFLTVLSSECNVDFNCCVQR